MKLLAFECLNIRIRLPPHHRYHSYQYKDLVASVFSTSRQLSPFRFRRVLQKARKRPHPSHLLRLPSRVFWAPRAPRHCMAVFALPSNHIGKYKFFPAPIVLQVDATTAEAFINCTARRSKLRHIDLAQERCILLRESKLFRAIHVPGPLNNSDIGTKIQGPQLFYLPRDRMFFFFNIASYTHTRGSPWPD